MIDGPLKYIYKQVFKQNYEEFVNLKTQRLSYKKHCIQYSFHFVVIIIICENKWASILQIFLMDLIVSLTLFILTKCGS